MKKLILFFVSAVSVSMLFLYCGGDSGGSGETTREYLGTQNPGDVWTWTITTGDNGSGTFAATNETLCYKYSGTVEILPNKFLKCLITSTDDPNMPNLPVLAYALEFPKASLIVKTELDPDMIVCVAKGNCPAVGTYTYNWVQLLDIDWTEAEEVYGLAEMTITGDNMTLDVTQYLINGTEGDEWTPVDTTFTCSDGQITLEGYEFVISMTPSGLYACDGGPGKGGNVGMIVPEDDIDLADLLKSGREFRGIKWDGGNDGPIWGEANGSNLTGGAYSDFEGGIEDRDHLATVTFGNQDFPGIFNSKMTYSNAPTREDDIVVIVNKIDGRYFCYGNTVIESGGGGNFFMIEDEE